MTIGPLDRFLNEYTSDVFSNTYDTALSLAGDVGRTYSEILSSYKEKVYERTTDVFPEDLGMDYYGHYLKIKAFTGASFGTSGYTPPATEQWNGYLFIPGGASGGQAPLIYDQRHNFTDIRLTNIINDSILGITANMATRKSLSPMVQVLYRSTNLRQFDFSFFMAAKSQREARAIKNIVKKMRAFAAPEINGYVVTAPAEFEFEFYNKGQINEQLPRVERCVITNVTANFAPQGDFSAFRDSYPVSCLLSFSATEIRVIDRNMIMDGKTTSRAGEVPARPGHGF